MAAASSTSIKTTCCIVGGGPAGIMLGFLLARAGIDVTVLEKHKDFFRDFRGDTIHPSTLQLLNELGLLDEFLSLPHQQITSLSMTIGGQTLPISDFSRLPLQTKFIALMPQWDFLNFLSSHAARLSGFHLLMEHEVTGLIENNHRVTGVRANTPAGPVDIYSSLVVGCDGRHATTRTAAHLHVQDTGAPIDILWFRLSRNQGEPENALGNINFGNFLILINRGDYYQCGFIIAKDSFITRVQPAGLPAFRASLVRLVPFLSDRVDEITSWDQLRLLPIQVNRLTRWHSRGLLCIGDAAHAMSPVGGIGINLAIQDAVAAARILAPTLKTSIVTELTLAHVQSRRELPTRLTQRFQVMVHYFLTRTLGKPATIRPPLPLRLLSAHPRFRYFMARFIGMGIRPEHI